MSMNKLLVLRLSVVGRVLIKLLIFTLLTLFTQIGGIIYILSLLLTRLRPTTPSRRMTKLLIFLSLYLFATAILAPLVAPLFGREKIKNTSNIRPANFAYVLLNRNYVKPALNQLLQNTANYLLEEQSTIEIRYLDANFPFINKFPLLPHLSHNDGKKIDISFVYQNKDGQLTNKQKSISGYGVFVAPTANEYNQIEKCINAGHTQYDFTKHTHLGRINKELHFSKTDTKLLIKALLTNKSLGKIFIEPHLKTRMGLNNDRIRYQGCHAVRHDDHIHVQLK